MPDKIMDIQKNKKTFFIADIHLSSDNDERKRLLTAFLDVVLSERGDLFILGDLFDFWANNRRLVKSHRDVFLKLQRLTAGHTRVGLLFGNRDFLISRNVLTSFGIDFLGEEAEISLDTRRVFLTHGHTLCLSDTQFLNYKNKMWPYFRTLDRFLPGIIENRIAQLFMQHSKRVIKSQDQARFQFTRDAIENLFHAGVDVVICGHTHKQEHYVSGSKCFYALPSWDDDTGHYLLHQDGTFSMHEITAPKYSRII
jgi:UDP-2,3-diacylglucosamine hydrolase